MRGWLDRVAIASATSSDRRISRREALRATGQVTAGALAGAALAGAAPPNALASSNSYCLAACLVANDNGFDRVVGHCKQDYLASSGTGDDAVELIGCIADAHRALKAGLAGCDLPFCGNSKRYPPNRRSPLPKRLPPPKPPPPPHRGGGGGRGVPADLTCSAIAIRSVAPPTTAVKHCNSVCPSPRPESATARSAAGRETVATIGLTARLVLAAVLATAGVGKLRHRPAALQMFRSLELPAISAGVIGLALLELALAAGLLIPGPLARPAAVTTAAVMTLFTALLAAALLRGRAPTCACLGRATPSPVTRFTLLRNLAFIAIAVLAATAPSAGALPHIAPATAVDLEIGAPPIVLAGLMIALLRRHGQALLQLHALESILLQVPDADLPAPIVELQRPDGERVTFPTPGGSDQPSLLVFIHPECGHCETLLANIRSWPSTATPGGPIIRPVAQATAETAARHYSSRELPGLLLDPAGAASLAYRINGFPAGVLINSDGRTASRPQLGAGAIRELHTQANTRRARRRSGRTETLDSNVLR